MTGGGLIKALKTSKGRRYKEGYSATDPFVSDYYRIVQSKSYKRLGHKTQVFSHPNNPHVMNRLTHTNHVAAMALIIADRLGLNQNLCLAIAAGHDIGHVPYGHDGEDVLTALGGRKFRHEVNSVVLVQHVEPLNLTYETLEGVLRHSRGDGPFIVDEGKPQEYAAVMFADKIDYLCSDLEDGMNYGWLSRKKLPGAVARLGESAEERKNNLINALIRESLEKDCVDFSDSREARYMNEIKDFLYHNFYEKKDFRVQRFHLEIVHEYFSNKQYFSGMDPTFLTSLLTDDEVKRIVEIRERAKKPGISQIRNFGIFDFIDSLRGKEIDYTDPDLDW